MKCQECKEELADLDCDDCLELESPNPDCKYCYGEGTIPDYFECFECGATFHISEFEEEE